MKNKFYKFEQYRDPEFPIYSSVQQSISQLVSPHFHNDTELIAVLSGEVALSIGVEQYTLRQGDIAVLPPSVIHSATAKTDDASIRGLVFDLKMTQLPAFVNKLRFASPNGVILKSTEAFTARVNSALFEAVKIYETESYGRKISLCGAVLTLLGVLCDARILTDETNKKQSRIDPALRYIEENYMHAVSVADISRTVNLCDDRFIRIFKELTAKTPTDYLIDFRLTEAMKLLVASEYSIAEIAEKTGFSTAGYFCRTFKNRIGHTPTQYRLSHIR